MIGGRLSYGCDVARRIFLSSQSGASESRMHQSGPETGRWRAGAQRPGLPHWHGQREPEAVGFVTEMSAGLASSHRGRRWLGVVGS